VPNLPAVQQGRRIAPASAVRRRVRTNPLVHGELYCAAPKGCRCLALADQGDTLTRSICRWVDVLSSLYATTGRSGSDLLRDDEGRAPQRRAYGDSKEYYRSRMQRADPRGPGRLTRFAIGTTARQHLGDSPPGPYWDGPSGKVIRHSIRQATLPFGESGPEQRFGALEDSEADGSRWTMWSDGT
jgi:hypothetical protein